MEHFPLAFCDFQTTFLKTRIKATEVCLLATSAGHLKSYSFSVYIILPENTHQYLFTAADNSPWSIFH
jgi:hypothetical protein